MNNIQFVTKQLLLYKHKYWRAAPTMASWILCCLTLLQLSLIVAVFAQNSKNYLFYYVHNACHKCNSILLFCRSTDL